MTTLYKQPAEAVYQSVTRNDAYTTEIEGVKLLVKPHVYPSERFRTTLFVLKALESKFKDKTVCDMGCGPGIVGLFSFLKGASLVAQFDINPYAVQNAKENIELNTFDPSKFVVLESDCFDSVNPQVFDLIIWNMPFHDDSVSIVDPLMNAFYDPEFVSIKKFLSQLPTFSSKKSECFIAFSSKGNVAKLENIFEKYPFSWELWMVTNSDQDYDNRIYKITF